MIEPDALRHPTHIRIEDFFKIIDHCGALLNKASPSKDDKKPC